MTCTAHRCDTPTADGIYVCDMHEGDLFTLLGQIPDTLTDAQDTIARLDTRQNSGRASATPGTPINLEASERVTELNGLLVSWSQMLHEATGEPGDAGANYLRANLREIVRHDWAGDMLDELQRAHRRVIQAIDTAPDWRTYGPCHIEGCTGLIRGKVGDVLARCRTCHEPYDATELMRTAIVNSWDKPAPLKRVFQAMELAGFPIPHRTLRSWVERGHLTPVGQDSRGRALFTMAAAWKVRANSA